MAEDLHSVAEMEAWDQVESFAGEAREERERETDIKRQHAEQHFEEEIEWNGRTALRIINSRTSKGRHVGTNRERETPT